jgi:hypothetical protein
MGNDPPFTCKYSNAFNANGQHNGWYGYDIAAAPAIITYDAASIFAHCINQAYLHSNNQITPQEIEYQLGQTIWPGVKRSRRSWNFASHLAELLNLFIVIQRIDSAHIPVHQIHIGLQHRCHLLRSVYLDEQEARAATGQIIPATNLITTVNARIMHLYDTLSNQLTRRVSMPRKCAIPEHT